MTTASPASPQPPEPAAGPGAPGGPGGPGAVGVVAIAGGDRLRGRVRTPGDKSISHRALLLAGLAEGRSVVRGLSDGDDVARTAAAVSALGAPVQRCDDGSVSVQGGRRRLRPAATPLDCGNSGTSMRLLCGVVAGIAGRSDLVGDSSLSRRPMDRVAGPLGLMGAAVTGRGPRCLPPLAVEGAALHGIEYEPPMSSAQVKSAVLLAGLSAEGPTVVREAVPTRSHTEEMLAAGGADVRVRPWNDGVEVEVRPSGLTAGETLVPGDPSQAAFWVVAATLVPGSTVTVADVYLGPARLGFVDVLRRMGAAVAVEERGPGAADLVASAAPLEATEVEAAEIPSLDEVPVLAVAAAAAVGTTVFHQVGELRVKEVDRLAAVVGLVNAFGARAEAVGDDLVVHGVGPGGLRSGHVHSGGDHRLAMAAAVAALAAGPGTSTVDGFEAVATSYPGFLADLGHLRKGGRSDTPAATEPGAGAPPAPGAPPGPAGAPVIAIDGPAGSGKSTVSKALAHRLGLPRLDTGAMYRAVAWATLERGIDPHDAEAVAALAAGARIDVGADAVHVDGVEVTSQIRSPEVSAAVSVVAANPQVRRQLVGRQRRWIEEQGGGVVEGRDIASVVWPAAELKVYLTASPEERARRRHDESAAGVARRDRLDTSRSTSPLAVAEGAYELDTTDRSVDDVVAQVLSWL